MDNHTESNALQHHGVKGQRWGVRRYQNKDGSLTPLGERRMGKKTAADKKAIENIKDQRMARIMTVAKQRQAMMQEALDRANARKIARGKLALEKQKARAESADKEHARKLAAEKAKADAADRENARKLAAEKLKLDKKDQKDRSKDKQTDRDIAKQKLKMELEKMRDNAKANDSSADDYYELPDTPERQQASSGSGKKVALAALGVVGTVAVAYAAKKYGPTIMEKIKNSKMKDTVDNVKETVAKNVDLKNVAGLLAATQSIPKTGDASSGSDMSRRDRRRASRMAEKVYKEASKYQGMNNESSTPDSSAADATSRIGSILDDLGDIPLYMGS